MVSRLPDVSREGAGWSTSVSKVRQERVCKACP